jgi:hypothetical protein
VSSSLPPTRYINILLPPPSILCVCAYVCYVCVCVCVCVCAFVLYDMLPNSMAQLGFRVSGNKYT